MARIRCKQTNADSFFGNFLYDQKVAKEHFLRKLSEVVDWNRFTKKLLGCYQGKGEVGQALYNPTIDQRLSENFGTKPTLILFKIKPSMW